MASVAYNSALNIGAFGAASIIGLALAPIIIGRWGVDGLGLITVSRLALPSGFGAVLDLGLTEATTRMVAGEVRDSSSTNGWRFARISLALLSVIGLVVASILFFGSERIAVKWLALVGSDARRFESSLKWTALSLVLLYPLTVVDAWLRGRERFRVLRAADVIQNLIYAGIVVWLSRTSASVEAVILWYCVLNVARGAALAFTTRSYCHGAQTSWRLDTRLLLAYAFAVLFNKSIGVALRFAPQFALATLSGPVAVGEFEALSRIPFFAKTVLGASTAAVLPAAIRLGREANPIRLWQRSRDATAVIGLLFIPGSVCVGAFGHFILTTWLGPKLAREWIYFALMMAWPATLASDTIRDAVLSIERQYLRRTAMVSLLQLAILLGVGLIWYNPARSEGFAFGLCLASCVGLLLRWRFANHFGAPSDITWYPIRGLLCVTAVAVSLSEVARHLPLATHPGVSIFDAGFFGIAMLTTGFVYIQTGIDSKTRLELMKLVFVRFPRSVRR